MLSDINSLAEKYSLDDRIRARLLEVMQRREATFKADMGTLWDVLATARNPPGLLFAKLNEMESGSFVPRGNQQIIASSGKDEVCGDWRRGMCTRGNNCKYAH